MDVLSEYLKLLVLWAEQHKNTRLLRPVEPVLSCISDLLKNDLDMTDDCRENLFKLLSTVLSAKHVDVNSVYRKKVLSLVSLSDVNH